MANQKCLGLPGRYALFKSNSGGIRFQMRTAGRSAELTLVALSDPKTRLYKLTLGHKTKVCNMGDDQEDIFPSSCISNINEFKEYYVTWHNKKIKVGLIGHEPFVNYDKMYGDPIVGYILFKTESRNSLPVEWIIDSSPVILKSISCKKFNERLHWRPLINGKLPPDAMIGGFDNELIYVARAEHNSSLCPGKYVPSTGKAFVPWGRLEYAKEEFEILCGFNAKWVKTRTNYIPQNAFIGGYSEVNNEPLYIGRSMINGKLICGKVHHLYKFCYLPFKGDELQRSVYDILVIPGDEIPQAIPLPLF